MKLLSILLLAFMGISMSLINPAHSSKVLNSTLPLPNMKDTLASLYEGPYQHGRGPLLPQPVISKPTCAPAQLNYPFVDRRKAADTIEGFCDTLVGRPEFLRMVPESKYYNRTYKFGKDKDVVFSIDNRLWLTATLTHGYYVDISKKLCKDVLFQALDACPPYKIEPSRNRLFKYGGGASLTATTGTVDFLVAVVPEGNKLCLDLMYPPQFCDY